MSIASLSHWIQDTGIATYVRESELLYPCIMTLHLGSIALFGGLILITDLRLLGAALRSTPAPELIARLRALGMLELIESVHAYFGDRAYGGSGYEVFWKDHVRLEDLRRLVDI